MTKKGSEIKKEFYFEGVGRRKTAVARVRVVKSATTAITVNGRTLGAYFPLKKHENIVLSPFKNLSLKGYKVTVNVSGGGVGTQAEAIRLGLARALTTMMPEVRSQLKALGYLTRDPRMVERKKYGKRKARRPQQWRKR
ncbi:MAG TPA: 30S ribosomal protein S9 [Candidatus Paceibacterota bacterium]|nr:30S ribosomal protein S9 [Candidatus Paceibacterota bacterium]